MTDAAGEEPTALDIISYVTNVGTMHKLYSDYYHIDSKTNSEFSYSSGLLRRKTIIECRSSGYNCAKLSKDNDLTSIEFGMPLSTWLNSMFAKVVLTKEDQEAIKTSGLIVSYERKNDEEIWIDGEFWTKIVYDWTALPDPESENVNQKEAKTNLQKFYKERNSRSSKFTNGPVLFWKSDKGNYSYDSELAKVVIDTTDYTGRNLGKVVLSKKEY